ncbi:MAG TPA: aminotransferase class I/II-fold pyridoxal phosphate-dependent enzyme [Phycisphaerales bacterium]|nr:aminotransferase class I/II-fold pyridoxal phosphate-dependent enzyme [Phycisphaerales bacterium]
MNSNSINLPTGPATAMPLYAPPSTAAPLDLHLDANEGPGSALNGDLARLVTALGPEAVRRYPDATSLERRIAERWNVGPSRVLVTAGGDEAIDRVCRVTLSQGRGVILPVPTFEMIGRFARLACAEVVTTEWHEGSYPVESVLDRVTDRTAMIVVVSPNNPTGAVATAKDLEQLAVAAPGAVLLVDCAYAEFADEDLTAAALTLPNAVVIRTFSKAFSMAGLRVGYAIGPERSIRAMRGVGSPFPVSGLSLAVAEDALANADKTLRGSVVRVRLERERLSAVLTELGGRPRPSQGNFVLADFDDADWVWRALAGLGIGVRRFAGGLGLDQSLRITCPGREAEFERLCRGLRSALRPNALLFDMDGVIADVSESYRRAISLTAASFGVSITPGAISAAKAEGDANNDWVLTQRLLKRRGVDAPLGEVTARFEALYHGGDGSPGLAAAESLIPDCGLLERLAARVPLAIVTGRPRQDCERFLSRFGLTHLFSATVCMEDGPAKPSPATVRRALELLAVDAAWMIGDTPDDVVAARKAGVVPIGIAPPGDASGETTTAMERAGAARMLGSLNELEGMLP